MPTVDTRHQLFEAARLQAGWTIQQLWIGYLAVGGSCDAFDIEAYLYGLGPLSTSEQDVLAIAVNEQLDQIYRGARVPYLVNPIFAPCQCHDPLAVIEELLGMELPEEP